MVMSIYKKAFAVLAKKPFKLWGISLLSGVITSVLTFLFGATIGIALALNLLITTSMTMVYLHGYKGEDVKVVQLFDCFKDWTTIKRVVCGMAWMYLWMFLYALVAILSGCMIFSLGLLVFRILGFVFLIAGLITAIVLITIKAYSWRFTPYILVHEQDIPLTEAIKISKQRTMGFKGKMFLADFLAYIFYFVAVLVLAIFASIPYIGGFFAFIMTLLSICFSIFSPFFFGLVQAAFYVEIENINKSGFNPYAQPAYAPQNPYGQNPYGQNPYQQQNPYAAPQQPQYAPPRAPQQPNPYAQQYNPYAQQQTPPAPQQAPQDPNNVQ